MSLTRKFLSALGVEPDKAEEIMQAHVETTNGLKSEINDLKAENETLKETAAKLPEVQKQLDEAQKSAAYKSKYEETQKAFEEYKTATESKAARQAKETAYRATLAKIGVAEKYLDTLIKASSSEIDSLELDENGAIANASEMSKQLKEKWTDFVVSETTKGAEVVTPPAVETNKQSLSSRGAELYNAHHAKMYGGGVNPQTQKGEN